MTALAYCTVTGNVAALTAGATGSPPVSTALTGQVTITCDARLPGKAAALGLPSTDQIVTVGPFPVALTAGAFSVEVPATGQTAVTVPDDFTYTATFDVTDSNGHRVKLPPLTFHAPVGTLDLSDVVPVPTSAGTFTGVTLAQVQALLGTKVTAPVDGSTPSATTYLRGDGTWASPPGGTSTVDTDGMLVIS